MTRTYRSLPLAALLAIGVNAQAATTVVNDPGDTGATTIYYSTCPSALTTTITLPTTTLNGGNPTMTNGPSNPETTNTILHVTFTGADGKPTEIEETETVFAAPCPSGTTGMCGATYTITSQCPCTAGGAPATGMPEGFTTTVTECTCCGEGGAPATITQTVPCSTGAYATVTPQIGPTTGSGSGLGAGAGSGSGSGAGAGSGSGSGAGAGSGSGSGSGSGAGAGSGSGSGAGAAAPGAASGAVSPAAASGAAAPASGAGSGSGSGSGAGAGAGSGSGSGAGAGTNSGSGAGAAPGGAAGAGAPSGGMPAGSATNGTINPPISPVNPATSTFTGAADGAAITFSTLFVALMGSLAWLL